VILWFNFNVGKLFAKAEMVLYVIRRGW